MDFNIIEEKMKKTISVFEENLAEVRAGRANPNILNKVTVDYYGVPTPINQMAGVSVPKVAVRSIRRDGIYTAKTAQKNGEMTEDELSVAEAKIQKMTDTNIDEIDQILEKKEKEIMTV